MSPREIDALVAGHCMGWLLSPTGLSWRTVDTTGIYINGWNHRSLVRNWHPSTDPADSKQLRDKMRADGWWCQIRNGWTLDDPKCWAGFTPHGVTGWNGRPDNWTEADTEEMAVALAALSTVGKPVAL